MAGDLLLKYGTTAQAITISLNSLASSQTAGRQSTPVVNNTTGVYFQDALVQVKVVLPTTGSLANDKTVYVYAYGTADETTPAYPAEVASATVQSTIGTTDAAYTLNASGSPLRLIGSIAVPTILTTGNGVLISNPMSVAAAFGGVMPPKWGIMVLNYCGVTLHSASNAAWYQGVYGQYT